MSCWSPEYKPAKNTSGKEYQHLPAWHPELVHWCCWCGWVVDAESFAEEAALQRMMSWLDPNERDDRYIPVGMPTGSPAYVGWARTRLDALAEKHYFGSWT